MTLEILELLVAMTQSLLFLLLFRVMVFKALGISKHPDMNIIPSSKIRILTQNLILCPFTTSDRKVERGDLGPRTSLITKDSRCIRAKQA